MNSGHGPGPEDPRSAAASPGDDADPDDWMAWRQGRGYSRPLPPEPEPRSGGYHRRSGEQDDGEHGALGRYGERGAAGGPLPAERGGPGEPGGTGERGPGERAHGDPDVPQGRADAARAEREEDYADFWRPGGRGGVHASRSGPPWSPAPPPPPAPGLPGDYRPSPQRDRWQAGLVIGVAAAVVVAGVIAVVLLLGRHGSPRHPTAGHASTPAASVPPASPPASAPATPPGSPPPLPPRTGASGHLGVPRQVGALLVNPWLTRSFVGQGMRSKYASSFDTPVHDVVGGFYTSDPAVAGYTAGQPRLMFLAAYLAGTGNTRSALHEFMTSHLFRDQRQVAPGTLGGVAACGLLSQSGPPVAHCMWADASTYADFYAWASSPSALARTMIGIRPRVEFSGTRR